MTRTSIPSSAAIAIALLVGFLPCTGAVAAGTVVQQSSSQCSPNIANVSGDVTVNISCTGVSKEALKKLNSDVKALKTIDKQFSQMLATLMEFASNQGYLAGAGTEKRGAGSLSVILDGAWVSSPIYPTVLNQLVRSSTSNFYDDPDKAGLSEAAKGRLNEFAQSMRRLNLTGNKILIQANVPPYCTVKDSKGKCFESSGSEAYLKSLSERHAGNVAHYLISVGIPSANISYRGLGNSAPLVQIPKPTRKDDFAAYNARTAINRRVEIIVMASESPANL